MMNKHIMKYVAYNFKFMKWDYCSRHYGWWHFKFWFEPQRQSEVATTQELLLTLPENRKCQT